LGSELTARQVVRTGVMGIVRGESPSMIEKRLQLYLKEIEENGGTAPPALKKAA
jgi:flagellar motor component MotA